MGLYVLVLGSLTPFLWLFSKVSVLGNFTYAFGNIAGFIGGTLMLWELVFGIRDLAKLLAPKSVQFMKIHIFLGVWGMFFVLVHPLLEMMIYAQNILYLFMPSFSSSFDTFITFGRLGFVLAIAVWVSSSFIRNKFSRKAWLVIHYSSYPLLFFVFIHALEVGSFIRSYPLIRAYWCILFGICIVLTIWRVAYAVMALRGVVGAIADKRRETI